MTTNRGVQIGLWTLKIVLALVFISAGVAKLVGMPMLIAEFDKIGLGQGLRYVTGVIEVASSALLLWSKTAFIGALGLTGVVVGAFIAQLGPLHGDVIHLIIIGLMVTGALWLTRPFKASSTLS